jgi:squalene-hopene/tetraprenyl-beta-curcumene cyclase
LPITLRGSASATRCRAAAVSEAVRRGIEFLLRTQQPGGLWQDPAFNAPGFPRVFYLKYHGYDKYFPLLALARYRNLTTSP